MKNSICLLPVLAASLVLLSSLAHAHSSHEEASSAAQIKPQTCAQLADRANYWVDLADPATKALKVQCDAASQSAIEKKAEEPSKK